MLRIAIFHCSIKIISRGKGKSAVAAAAYRSGETITNEYDGITHDYTRKGGIVHTEILLSDHAPREYADRSVLWNAVEKVEKAKNSQLAREIEIALPAELTREENISLVRMFVKEQFVSTGMCADMCIHDNGGGNPHAHIMLTMRPILEDGNWGDKQRKEYILNAHGGRIYDAKKRQYKCKSEPTTDWNEQTKAEDWRKAWAAYANTALRIGGHAAAVDHRSYKRQGIEQIPTIHLGAAASQMERRGVRTARGNINHEIEISNQRLRQLRARINRLTKWVNESGNAPAPTLQDVFSEILSGGENKSRYGKIRDLQAAAKVLIFLQTHDITDLAGLREKVGEFYGRQQTMREKLKPVERRLKTLDEHLAQAETYKKYSAIFKKYQSLKPKYREGFYEGHRAEIVLYESAKRYLDAHLNGHTLPLKAWTAEREKLAADKAKLTREYNALKDEIREVEVIHKAAEQAVRENQPPQRARDFDAAL